MGHGEIENIDDINVGEEEIMTTVMLMTLNLIDFVSICGFRILTCK